MVVCAEFWKINNIIKHSSIYMLKIARILRELPVIDKNLKLSTYCQL
jgi:hypothetical protein